MAAMVVIWDIRSKLDIFYLQLNPSQLAFWFRRRSENRFSRFSIGTILAIFDPSHPMLPTKFRVSWRFGSGKEAKTDFQDGHHGDHLGFPIGTSLAIFELQVNPMIPTMFRVHWLRGVGGIGFQSNCWRRTPKDGWRMTDDARQTLTDHTLSTSCSGELKFKA